MKAYFYLAFYILLIISRPPVFAEEAFIYEDAVYLLRCCESPTFAQKSTGFYNEILNDQAAIEKINLQRPKIYIYTDFGGGTVSGKPLIDLQTSGEIASAGWKTTL